MAKTDRKQEPVVQPIKQEPVDFPGKKWAIIRFKGLPIEITDDLAHVYKKQIANPNYRGNIKEIMEI